MRTLKFIVNGQIISPDPNCDFSGLVPGTAEYLKAEFSFSSEWKDHVKVAAFSSRLGQEYEPQVLRDGYSCMIPSEATDKRFFKIKILGKSTTTTPLRMETNKITIDQNGGKS